MADFNLQPTFPIASIVDAAQKKAQLEQQAAQNNQAQLVQGLQAVGQIGQSLFDQKRKMAQALALGRQFGIAEEEARLMSPDQIVDVVKAKQNEVQLPALMLSLKPELADNPSFMQYLSRPEASSPNQGAQLISNETTPKAAPIPSSMNKTTAGLLVKGLTANRPKNVITKDRAIALGQVPPNTQIVDNTGDDGKKERQQINIANQIVSKFNADPTVRKQQQSIDGAITVRELAVSGNPIAAAAIPTYMARASGEVGNLSEADKRPFGGTRAILGRMEAALQEMASGQLSQSNRDFLLELSELMEKNANRNLDRKARIAAKQYSKANRGMKAEDLFESLRPEGKFEEEVIEDFSRMSDDELKRIAGQK